jgi:glucose-6-phosphate isomerase
LTECPAWETLRRHYETIEHRHLRELFSQDPLRGERFGVEAAGLYLDYSKNRITEETLRLLVRLAEERGLPSRISAMFRGDRINVTEDRPALHIALRCPVGEKIRVDGIDVVPDVHRVLDRMAEFSERVRDGRWLGHTGQRIRTIVNIGIGGSDLGPVMAYEALRHYGLRELDFRFVANVDPSDFAEAVRGLDPERTLFIVCSKTFSTQETLANARLARAWILAAMPQQDAIGRHFVAVSSNTEEAARFGIDAAHTFGFWDWVGGRYSIGSAIGLSTLLSIGAENFRAMLAGFRAMDEHFRETPLQRNMPVLLGLLSVWNVDFLGAETVAVLPYDHYLRYFPSYLQQLTMESNGKRVTMEGAAVGYRTGPVYWGASGTNGQHSFHQWLHQGSSLAACDFIGFCRSLNPAAGQHDVLIANLFAQSEALAFGKTVEQARAEGTDERLAPHRSFEGNRPSNTLLAECLTPFTLGALVALYEHSVFVQSVIWNINAFDQWGVELGKQLAIATLAELQAPPGQACSRDSSTRTLIERYRRLRREPDGL